MGSREEKRVGKGGGARRHPLCGGGIEERGEYKGFPLLVCTKCGSAWQLVDGELYAVDRQPQRPQDLGSRHAPRGAAVRAPQATRETERIVKAEIRSLPDELEEVPPGHHAFDLPLTLKPVRAWTSRHFVVQLYEEGEHRRLSVQRAGANGYIRPANRDMRPISWDELMTVKREAGLGGQWAVEVYPPDEEVIDVAPMRHLWLLPEAPPYAWSREGGR